jgi:hypothetical protein
MLLAKVPLEVSPDWLNSRRIPYDPPGRSPVLHRPQRDHRNINPWTIAIFFGKPIMALGSHKIDFDSLPEAVFQSCRNFAIQNGMPIGEMPVYDFGQLLNERASQFIGVEAHQFAGMEFAKTALNIGFRLPHPQCAMISRYSDRERNYMFMMIGSDDGKATQLTWLQWGRQVGWEPVISVRIEGDQYRPTYLTEDRSEDYRRIIYRSLLAAVSVQLYLIFERGGAVESTFRPPRTTNGRTRVHPLAPSSVITIDVNRARIIRPPERPPAPPVEEDRPKATKRRHDRAAAVINYKHPRYKNVKQGFRKGSKVNGGADEPAVYKGRER